MDAALGPEKRDAEKKSSPFLIENVYEKETTESFIERHFRDSGLHRCRCTAEFDVEAIADQYRSELVRSGQELELNPDGSGHRPQWTMLVFKRASGAFWHFVIKSDNSYGSKDGQKDYMLTVSSNSSEEAATDALMLQKHFTADDGAPGFFMVRNVRKPRRIPLKPEYGLSTSLLELHYGLGFADWADQFGKGLDQNGLSILRGKPGTGKTSFLRHLILNHASTHRFYYLPVDAFGLLQGQVADFLERERRRFKDAVLVLVLEDAEQLLQDRRGLRDGLASSLLNFSDGFIGDLIHAHLICTINGDFKDIDEAVLRPGRQRFFREFEPLGWDRALTLADRLGISLTEKRAYTLAEIYHFKDMQNPDRLRQTDQTKIGFASL